MNSGLADRHCEADDATDIGMTLLPALMSHGGCF